MKFMSNYQASTQTLNNGLSNCAQIVILAAGKGSRMKSEVPKVLQLVGGKPMIERVFEAAKQVTSDIIVVCSPSLEAYANDNFANAAALVKLVVQTNPLGTAHAVYSAIDVIDKTKFTVVLYADNPFITPEIIEKLLRHLVETDSSLVTLAFNSENPAQYGRIITSQQGEFLRIVEFKDASENEKAITLCNSGVMTFAPNILHHYLPLYLRPDNERDNMALRILKNGKKSKTDFHNKEFYLTKIVQICKNDNCKVSYFLADNFHLAMGVNTLEELDYANSHNFISKVF